MKEHEERFAAALHNAARAWRQALDRRLKHLGISGAGWMTIAAAAHVWLMARPLSASIGDGATTLLLIAGALMGAWSGFVFEARRRRKRLRAGS
jgi:hypothetical protein